MTRRQMEAALKSAEARCDEMRILLAALAIEYGEDARLRISGQRIDDVLELSASRVVALQRLDTGDFRLDFCAPRVETPDEAEAVCQ
jgi:hypothetical protein